MVESVPSGTGAGASAAGARGNIADGAVARRISPAFVLVYAFAYMGVWLALLTPMLVTISLRVREISPTAADAERSLALVLGVGAIFALIGNPLFGRMSDRTTSRVGMRRPWLVGGMLCGCAALALIALAPTIPVVLAGWCLAQLAFNAVLAAIVALLPDQVPPGQRGTVSGVLGICMSIGQVAGTFLVQALPPSMPLMFLVPAIVGMIAVFVLAWILPDRRQRAADLPPADVLGFLRSFWLSPRRYPDFFWAWFSRFLLVTGTAFLTTYQPYYLMNELHYPESEVRGLIFKAMLVQASLIVIASLVSGRVSDALGRRKIFVTIAAAIYGVGLWTVASADSYANLLFGMVFTGTGQGVYFAVELALVTQILPNHRLDAAKDLGMFNIANALPQAVAPALGPIILWMSGGDYTWLFIVAGTIALMAALAILPLKGVK